MSEADAQIVNEFGLLYDTFDYHDLSGWDSYERAEFWQERKTALRHIEARLAEVERERDALLDDMGDVATPYERDYIHLQRQLTQAREALTAIAEGDGPSWLPEKDIARQALATINREGETG